MLPGLGPKGQRKGVDHVATEVRHGCIDVVTALMLSLDFEEIIERRIADSDGAFRFFQLGTTMLQLSESPVPRDYVASMAHIALDVQSPLDVANGIIDWLEMHGFARPKLRSGGIQKYFVDVQAVMNLSLELVPLNPLS